MSEKIRLLSFQSEDVLASLLKDGVYLADTTKSRERRDYSRDIAQLNGSNPIWCFSPVGLKTSVKDKFIKEDFIDGKFFFNFNCEMSTRSPEDLNNKVILEIEVDKSVPKIGLTHNAYIGAVVIPKIAIEDLKGVYRLHYDNEHNTKWFYPDVNVLMCKEDSLFTSSFSCVKIKTNKYNIE
ncbi:hypothetical protein D3C81_07980 [compost metagenome]